jgi:GDPmannose 4,6-dehydratase
METTNKPQPIALITGIGGQDGSYLAELLLEKGYQVHGLIRRSSQDNLGLIEHLKGKITLHHGDLANGIVIDDLIRKIMPDEVYNLGAQSHVGISFQVPEYTADVVAMGALRLLEAIRRLKPQCKFYQASTSEMFGKVHETPQKETTPFYPRSPYGVSKLFAHWMAKNYRESFGMFCCSGILFNHESPRRGKEFVTRKITQGLARIKAGKQEFIELGNMDAKRDWGHAKDYVWAMWKMLQMEKPDDYVLATGETRTVREFVEIAGKKLGFDIVWQGSGVDEIGIDKNSNNVIIKISKEFYRPAEVDLLLGDPTKARQVLGWDGNYTFEALVEEMCREDEKQQK